MLKYSSPISVGERRRRTNLSIRKISSSPISVGERRRRTNLSIRKISSSTFLWWSRQISEVFGFLQIYNVEEEITQSRHAKEQVNSISARKRKSKLSLSKLKRKNDQSQSQLAEEQATQSQNAKERISQSQLCCVMRERPISPSTSKRGRETANYSCSIQVCVVCVCGGGGEGGKYE